ncbi:hypothetical protein AAHK20_21015 [Trinickia sp. YCB016]
MVILVVPREKMRAREYKLAELQKQASGQAMLRKPAASIDASI